MEDCIFCKIIHREIPCEKILETENFIAIKDANPKVANHSLIISRKHYETFLDMPSELYREFLEFTKDVIKKLSAEDFNLVVNNGKFAGQLISHVHLHILPREEGDGFRLNV